MRSSSLHTSRRDGPDPSRKVQLLPSGSEHFTGPGCRENGELQRPWGNAIPLPQSRNERGHHIKRHGFVVSSRELRPLRQNGVQVSPPPGWVLARYLSPGASKIEDPFNASSKS